MLKFTITPDAQFLVTERGLRRVAATAADRLAISAAKANTVMLASLKAATPIGAFHTDDGPRLSESYGSQIAGGDPTIITFTNARLYFPFVEYGHGDIYPVEAKALAFEVEGGVVFASHVKATDPHPMRAPAAKSAVPALVQIMMQHAEMIYAALRSGQ